VSQFADPIGYVVIWQCEPDVVDCITFTTDRDEAHRLFEDSQRLDDEVVARASHSAAPGRVTLSNVYSPTQLFEMIATDAVPWSAS
jgi:hypothetical protein